MLELKIYLMKQGVTQYQLAERLGVTQQYVSDVIRGKRKAHGIRHRMVDELGYPAGIVNLPIKKKKAKVAA